MGQMVTHTVMSGLLADKMVEVEVHIVMCLLEDIHELVDVMWQSVAVKSMWSFGYIALC